MTHVIRYQCLHVQLHGTEQQGKMVLENLQQWLQQRLAHSIEQVFEQYNYRNDFIVIKHLELDLGIIDINEIELNLIAVLTQSLQRWMKKYYSDLDLAPPAATENISKRTLQQTHEEAWLYFLKAGHFPWYYCLPDFLNLEQLLLRQWKAAPLEQPFLAKLLMVLSSSTSRLRLTKQFSIEFIRKLLTFLAAEYNQQIEKVLSLLQFNISQIAVCSGLQKQLIAYLFDAVIMKIACGENRVPPPSVYNLIISLDKNTLQELFACGLLTPFFSPAAELNNTIVNNTELFKHKNEKILSISSINYEQAIAPPCSEMAEYNQLFKHGVYIENAGLVLLHPFLPQLFKTLKCYEIKTNHCKDRALLLLHYLASGKNNAAEYELVLAKALCNFPVEVVPNLDQELTLVEQQEANQLLTAVIKHWSALKEASIEGLRAGFLLRKGKLSLRDDGDWLLQIESKSYDVLLEKLPWAINMIQLPWMKSLLRVEWIG